jgi:hypothetical protein
VRDQNKQKGVCHIPPFFDFHPKVAIEFYGGQNGFGCYLMVMIESILFDIQQWQLNLVAIKSILISIGHG